MVRGWRSPSVSPASASTASTKGSGSPACSPAEAMKVEPGNRERAMHSAIGERTVFMRHMNSTERGSGPPVSFYPRQCSTQTSVNSLRAVPKSMSILPASRSISV